MAVERVRLRVAGTPFPLGEFQLKALRPGKIKEQIK